MPLIDSEYCEAFANCLAWHVVFQMISGYFDATSGPRTEKDTYAKIAKEIELAPADVLYLTGQPTGVY